MNVFCTNLNFLTFKVAKEEDVRDHFQVIILPSFLCEPLCKLLNSWCQHWQSIHSSWNAYFLSKTWDGIMQRDGKQSFAEFTLKGLCEHPQSDMFCVAENVILQLNTTGSSFILLYTSLIIVWLWANKSIPVMLWL